MVEVIGSTLGINEEIYLGSSDGSFDGSNDITLEGSCLEDSF